jgi:choice-of-anchor A domain-containing protein
MFPNKLAASGFLVAAAIASGLDGVHGFDAQKCDVYVFRTQENALWHCGSKLPGEQGDRPWESLYCDHSMGDQDTYPFAWASDHPDDWCQFMISTVRQTNEDHYPLTPEVEINMTPGPNKYFLSTLVDWGCYVVENGVTTEAYLIDSRKGEHASTVTQQCDRSVDYFNYWNLHPNIRDVQWTGSVPEQNYVPHRQAWGRCHYDDAMISPNYEPSLGVKYAECTPGFVCELKYQDYAACMPDPHADHECCVSWNNKCENAGDCCLGSECNDFGYCEVGLPQQFENPPGICADRTIKEDKELWNRCLDFASGGQGDCAEGYVCLGDWWYAQCEIDHSVKNDCCKYNFDDSNPRPGDCCVGWRSHCLWEEDGVCVYSQCLPGREMGVDESGNSMLDVHDRICSDVPALASYNEELGKCVGAVCGVWGDPHIITCDDLHYDCQAVGLFTIMKNHMFNVQGNFVFIDTPWGGASITNDLAIDYLKNPPNGVPTMQFSFPNFEKIDPNNQVYDERSREIGPCPVYFYIDQQMVDISAVPDDGYLYGDANSDHNVKLTGWNQIDINHKVGVDANGDDVFSSSIIWIEGGGPFSEWSCIISYFLCLPGEDEELFRQTSVGLLGTPTGTTKDDWMAPDGQTLMIPDTDRVKASFDYCLENWCVDFDSSIMTYEDGLDYEDYMCTNQEFFEFDVNKCSNAEQLIEECAESDQVIACQMEKCAGNQDVDKDIEIITDIKPLSEDPVDNILEFPEVVETIDPYEDCANLGAGLSAASGKGAWTEDFPIKNCIYSATGGFSLGYDKSVSLLVGGDFHCKQGSGFEGHGVFLGDATLDQSGCERLAATAKGSLIHPFDNTACVEVGGSLSIDSSFSNSKYIMYEYGNNNKACHLLYKGGCEVNGEPCPTNMTKLEESNIYTNGDFKQNPDLDLSRWEEELVLLNQKTDFWKTLEPNGVAEVIEGIMYFGPGPDNNPVQIFNIKPIETTVANVVFKKEMIGKTIMIVVEGDGTFMVPPMCFHPLDFLPGDAPICGVDTFPTSLTASIVWVFPTSGKVEMVGSAEFMGSIVMPKGDLTFTTTGHNGRLLIGGDFTLDGAFSELHNYEFDPASHPLPLGEDLSEICEIKPPPPCDESLYKVLTSETACPSKPDGVVKLIKKSADAPEGEPILYGIIIEPPKDINSASTVKFKVDNPFTNHTDIYIKHVKKVGKYAMDPTCQSMPFTAGCQREAPEIEVGCHEYQGVEPFALVNVYFASNSDAFVKEISSGDVDIDKCCHPPEEYNTDAYGIVEYTFEIQCTCPYDVSIA